MLQKLSKKTKGLVKALPLIFGLGLTAPKVQAQDENKSKGYFEAAGEIAQFTGDNYLTEVYGNAFGGSVGGGIRIKGPLHFGGRLTFLTGSGDYKKERSFASQSLESQSLTIVGLEPYIELSGNNLFARFGYGNYSISDQIREQSRSWFKEQDNIDSYKSNVSGPFYELGAKVPLTVINSTSDGAILVAFNIRSASPVKTLSAKVGAEFKF